MAARRVQAKSTLHSRRQPQHPPIETVITLNIPSYDKRSDPLNLLARTISIHFPFGTRISACATSRCAAISFQATLDHVLSDSAASELTPANTDHPIVSNSGAETPTRQTPPAR